jgi:hypothetical protein
MKPGDETGCPRETKGAKQTQGKPRESKGNKPKGGKGFNRSEKHIILHLSHHSKHPV